VVSLSFSPDGKFLASAGKDRKLCIWSKACNQVQKTSFNLSAIVESAHKRIIWSTDFCPIDATILATGSRDGFVKIWRVQEEPSSTEAGKNEVAIKEIFRFQPVCKQNKKVEPVTAVAFAHQALDLVNGNGPQKTVKHAILAVGVESGLIETWAVPLNEAECSSPTMLHSIPLQDCHLGVVKKLAWRPSQRHESKLTLASCGTDHGIRMFDISLS